MAGIESSKELQEIVLSTIMKDPYMYTRVSRYIRENSFTKYSYKLMYRCLNYYYDKYNELPSRTEMGLILSEFNDGKAMDISEVLADFEYLSTLEFSSPKFVEDTITSFIRRVNVETILNNYIPALQSGESVSMDRIGEDLAKGLDFSLKQSAATMLSDTSNLAKARADAIGTESNPTIIKSSFPGINNSLQFKGYKPGDLVMICAAPGVGKTMFMTNEGSTASQQGFKVLHLFIGDMKEYDGIIRYTSNYTNIPQDDLVFTSVQELDNIIKKHNYQAYFTNIVVASYAAGEITIGEMVQEVSRLQKELQVHFDMILVDYADNLIPDSDMMYESGGSIYNKLSNLAGSNRSVVIVGSQPKPAYWDDEILPKNAAADSSRKQHVIDIMLTMGKVSKESTIGSIFMPKVRRGKEGGIIRFRTEYECAKILPIPDVEYLQLKGAGA